MVQLRSLRTPTRLLLASLAVLFASEVTARAELYTFRDAQGVSHFSRDPRPGWKRLDGRRPRASVADRKAVEKELESIIRECAEEYRVEAALVKAVIRAESGFDADAVSPVGARGLMQLMPVTAGLHGVESVHDPRDNIRGGVRHLRSLLDLFHNDRRLAVAAYNAGSAAVLRHGGLPPYRETRSYVIKVLRFRLEYLRRETLNS